MTYEEECLKGQEKTESRVVGPKDKRGTVVVGTRTETKEERPDDGED